MIRKYNGTNLRIPGVGTSSALTSSDVDTILNSVAISSNTFIVGDCIKIRSIFTRTTTQTSTYDIKLHWSPVLSLSSATQLAVYSSLSGDSSPSLYRTMTFKSNGQAYIYSTGTSAVNDIGIGQSGASGTTLSGINITSNGYIITSARLTSPISRLEDLIRNYYLTIEV